MFGQVASTNFLGAATIKEYRKTARKLSTPPWTYFKAAHYLEKLCQDNEERKCGARVDLRFVFDHRLPPLDRDTTVALPPPVEGTGPREITIAVASAATTRQRNKRAAERQSGRTVSKRPAGVLRRPAAGIVSFF